MKSLSLGGYVVEVDTDATAAAHASESAGGPEECACWYCRNWIAGRVSMLPSAVGSILDALAIPRDRETEVWEVPGDTTPHIYGGWYTFVGRLVARPPAEAMEFVAGRWKLSFSAGSAYALPTFAGHEVVELHFLCDVANWIDAAELDEPGG